MTPTPVLVEYATRYGSTQEVAEAVAATLREGGLEVDVQPMREVQTLGGYGALVLGAPLYMGRWHKDAQCFLVEHREALTKRLVAVFALGQLSADEQEIRESRNHLDEELENYPWLEPVALEMFGGKYDPSKLGLSHRLLTALPASSLHGLDASDVRDWTAIRAWESELAQELQAALS
jgi:menaquinone-dependent protoporphyrinogen oxidase